MKRHSKRRGWKIAVTMMLGILAVSTIGFSSWVIVNEDTSPTAIIDINGAEIREISDGFSVSVSPLKMGKYNYENGDTTSDTGYLTYTFTITPNALPDMIKYQSGNGYQFTLSGTLTNASTQVVGLFSDDYMDGAVVEAVTDDLVATTPTLAYPTQGNYASISSFSITTADRGGTPEVFTLSFKFKQLLLWASTHSQTYRSLLEDSSSYFVLKLQGGVA